MIGRVKHGLRRAVVHSAHALGLLSLRMRLAPKDQAAVLMYHRVLPSAMAERSWSHPGIIVTPETFDRHMRLLRTSFRVLGFDEFEQRLDAGAGFEPGSCLVTFDDGWIDTYDYAFPILQRHRIPALVFLPSAYIGSRDTFWQEHLGKLLHEIYERARLDEAFAASVRAPLQQFGLTAVLELSPAKSRAGIIELVRRRKRDVPADPFACVRALAPFTDGRPAEVDSFVTWDQVREMRDAGITFGAHSHTHRQLTALPMSEVRDEIARSRQVIEDALGQRPRCFSFPNGDTNDAVLDEIRQSGFPVAFATASGPVTAGSDRHALQRLNIHESVTDDDPMFLARVVGAFN